MPAMPRISVPGAPSKRQASFCATSESFMDEAPRMRASLAHPQTSGEQGIKGLVVTQCLHRVGGGGAAGGHHASKYRRGNQEQSDTAKDQGIARAFGHPFGGQL